MKKPINLGLVVLALLLTGCETSHKFVISAMNQPASLGQYRTYALASSPDTPAAESLLFREAARYLDAALLNAGFRPASSVATAEILIEVGFGVSQPQTAIRQSREPLYVQTADRYTRRIVQVQGSDGKIETRAVYTYQPGFRTVAGWTDSIQAETVYDKHLKLIAYRPTTVGGEERHQEVWNVEVSNRNSNRDLRYFIPRLVTAAMDYFDADTGSLITRTITDSDPNLRLILTAQGDLD